MPKRNYGFEKRQKDLNKKRKREEREQRKLDRTASGASPRDTFDAYSAALDRGDLDAMAELIDDEFRFEGAGADTVGKREFLAALKTQLDAFPDYTEGATDLVEEGDVIYFVANVRGTQRGALALPGAAPIPPTGREVRLPPASAWVRVHDGRLLAYHLAGVPGGGIEGIVSQLQP